MSVCKLLRCGVEWIVAFWLRDGYRKSQPIYSFLTVTLSGAAAQNCETLESLLRGAMYLLARHYKTARLLPSLGLR